MKGSHIALTAVVALVVSVIVVRTGIAQKL